jgi:catechol 2,3-dioxygenase-like lactoylglutathione lyase family enzyme
MDRPKANTHLQLIVADLERSLAFYRQAVGMEEVFREGPLMAILKSSSSDETITLHTRPAFTDLTRDVGVAPVGFRLGRGAGIADVIAKVTAAGGKCIGRAANHPSAAFTHVVDPDGYLVQI